MRIIAEQAIVSIKIPNLREETCSNKTDYLS